MALIHSYGFVDQRYMQLAGDAAKNLLLVSVKFPVGADLPDSDPQKARIAALTRAFEAKFKRKPNQFAAQTYDAIWLTANAMEKAGGTDRAKRTQAALDAYTKINASTQIDVETIGWGDYWTRLATQVAGGNAPATDPTTTRSSPLFSSTASAVGSSAVADSVKRSRVPASST